MFSGGVYPVQKWISVFDGGKKWYKMYSKWERVGD